MDSQDFFSTSAAPLNDGALFDDFDSYLLDTTFTDSTKAIWDWNDVSGAMDSAAMGNVGTLNFSQDSAYGSANDTSPLIVDTEVPPLVRNDTFNSSDEFTSSPSDGPITPKTTPEEPSQPTKDEDKPGRKRSSKSSTTTTTEEPKPPCKKRGRRAIKRSEPEKVKYEKEKRRNNAIAAAKSRVKKADQQKDLLHKAQNLGAQNAELIRMYEGLKMDLMLLVEDAKTHNSNCAEGILQSLAQQSEHTLQTDHVGLMRDDIVNSILGGEESVNGYEASERSFSVSQ